MGSADRRDDPTRKRIWNGGNHETMEENGMDVCHGIVAGGKCGMYDIV